MTTGHPFPAHAFPLPRSAFRYGRTGPWPQPAADQPMFMAAEVMHLPKAEQKHWDWTVRLNYLKAMLTKTPLALYNWFIHSRIDHLSDAECAWMLTTTCYAKYLRRRTAADLAGSDFVAHLGPLDPAREYLISDFTTMQDLTPYPGMFVAPTVVLYGRATSAKDYQLLAISIGHLQGGRWQHLVMTPADGHAWTLSKYYAVQGAAHMTSLSGHPATHFPYDTVNAITVSAIPTAHTLFKLLAPHLELHLAVDHAVLEGGDSIVSERHGEFYAPYVCDGTNIRQLVPTGYIGYPNPLSKYQPSDTPGPNYQPWRYPKAAPSIPTDYGRFLAEYYETVRGFVREVIAPLAQDDDGLVDPLVQASVKDKATREALAAGPAGARLQREEERFYIRRWAHYIAQILPGFPDEDAILAPGAPGDPYPNLVAALTTYIWDVGIAHGLEHNAYYKLGPHRTGFRVRIPPPAGRDIPAFRRRDVLHGWDMFKSTLAFEMFFRPHIVTHLLDADYPFDDPAQQAAAARFKQALRATEQRLAAQGVNLDQYARLDELASSIQY